MKLSFSALALGFVPVLALACAESKAPAPVAAPMMTAGDKLAARVMAYSGAKWPTVSRLKFTFNVEDNGVSVAKVSHDWDVAAGKDTVSWGEKTVTIDVAGPHETEDEKAAFAKWTNDSYWLLAPLKVMDGGVKRERLGDAEGKGRRTEVLSLTFGEVGLTPKNEYRMYIDPATSRLVAWDYIPDRTAETPKVLRFTWEAYVPVGPLMLSTEHRTPDGVRRIFFTDVSAETK